MSDSVKDKFSTAFSIVGMFSSHAVGSLSVFFCAEITPTVIRWDNGALLFKGQRWNYPHLIDNWPCKLTHCMGREIPIISELEAILGLFSNLMSLQSVCLSKCLSGDTEALFPMAPPCVPLRWLSAGQPPYKLHLFAAQDGFNYLAEPNRMVEPCYCFIYSAGFVSAVTMWVYRLIVKEKFHECAEEGMGAGNPCFCRAGWLGQL